MAKKSPDGSPASSLGARAYNFAANGGGAITIRMVLVALCTVIAGMVSLMWTDLQAGQRSVAAKLDTALSTISAMQPEISNNKDGVRNLWKAVGDNGRRLDDHEARISHIEGKLNITSPHQP